MNVIITLITYYDTDEKTIKTINVLTDGKKALTDSKAKKYIKETMPNAKFIEKDKSIIQINATDIYNTPLKDVLDKKVGTINTIG